MIKLGKNERLVSAGTANLRTPSGELVQGVQQYRIVSVQEANPEDVVTLQQNERLVYAGQVCDKKRAEDRFGALKAGKREPPKEKITPLFFIEDAAKINQDTGMTCDSEMVLKDLSRLFAEMFDAQRRKGLIDDE